MKYPPQEQALLQRFFQVRQQTEKLCLPLLPEDTVVQPIVDVSPPKWHLAHTSWFFETFLLQPHLPGYQVYHPGFAFLFNSYYNSLGSRVMRDQRGTLSRPALAEIYAYRSYVEKHMERLIPQLPESLLPLLDLGLQHEQQHQELLVTDIKYILSTNPLLPAYQQAPAIAPPPALAPAKAYLEVPEGFYTLGYQDKGFCFDNEQPAHQVWLPAFRACNRLVTNGEYLEFIADGGYRDFRHWLGEGFELARQQNWEAPLYWVMQEESWKRFTLHGLQALDLEAPVSHLSFYEAAAYAQWAGERLLTEAEWEALSQVHPGPAGQFLESGVYDPGPAQEAGAGGCHQLLGEVWEWTHSAYLPYPGYVAAAGALGEYNGKFMINQMVLRGGSCATPASHIRSTYRNFFHPDKRWQFTGIRLAKRL
ncbi:MAG: ergothioneine biosynthesis protein EgtB [Adhaeribacter sp.]